MDNDKTKALELFEEFKKSIKSYEEFVNLAKRSSQNSKPSLLMRLFCLLWPEAGREAMRNQAFSNLYNSSLLWTATGFKTHLEKLRATMSQEGLKPEDIGTTEEELKELETRGLKYRSIALMIDWWTRLQSPDVDDLDVMNGLHYKMPDGVTAEDIGTTDKEIKRVCIAQKKWLDKKRK